MSMPALSAHTTCWGKSLEQLGDRQGAIGEYRFSLALASGYHPAQDALRRLGA
jgi:hypothetical protein